MPARLGPRFALEAAFLILLAVGAGLADLSSTAIVLVMAAAWVIVAVIEFTAERLGTAFPPLRRAYVAPPPVRRRPEADLVEATVVTPVPAAPPTPEREDAPAPVAARATNPEAEPDASPRRRFWQRRQHEQTPEEGEVAPPPRHVRLLPRRNEPSRAVEEVAEIFDRAETGDDR
jgi:hypothetical protein